MSLRSVVHAPMPGSLWLTINSGLEAVGDSIARSLMPIVAVAVLGAGTTTVGVINSLGLLAFLLLSVPVGVLADRMKAPEAMMLTSTLVRAGVVAFGSCAWLVGWLDGAVGVVLLLVMAGLVGVADVGYASGQGLLVPRIAPPDHIRPLMGRVQSAAQAGGAGGPAVLSGLLLFTAPPLAWFGASVAYLASAAAQRRIPKTQAGRSSAPRVTAWVQVRAGTRLLLKNPLLARITLANMFNNAAVMSANTLMPVLALNHLGLSAAAFAAVGSLGAVAGILGALSGSRLTQQFGLRGTRLGTALCMVSGVVVIILASPSVNVLPGPAIVWVGGQAVLSGAAASVAMVAGADLAPRLVPERHLGVAMGAQRSLVMGVMPIAGLAAGLVGSALGAGPALWLWLAFTALAAIPILRITR